MTYKTYEVLIGNSGVLYFIKPRPSDGVSLFIGFIYDGREIIPARIPKHEYKRMKAHTERICEDALFTILHIVNRDLPDGGVALMM